MRLLFGSVGLILIGTVLIVAAYWQGLGGPFIFDDFPNIVDNQVFIERKGILDGAFSTNTGPLARPISMASLWLNYHLNGDNSWAFKITNLFIHCICVLLAIFFILQVLRAFAHRYSSIDWLDTSTQLRIAILSGVLWGLHPINLTSVLYVVQRMTSLSGLFVLLGLALYCWGRNQIISEKQGGWWAIVIALIVVFPLALLSKENSLVWPLWVMALEWLIFGCRAPFIWQQKIFKYSVITACAALLLLGIWLLFNHQWIVGGYASRDFTLEERFFTQPRVLWHYVYWVLVPQLNSFGLYHDDFVLSSSLWQPWATVIAFACWLLVVVVIIAGRSRFPWFSLIWLFFLIGHLLESTIFPLEMVHEHRNYIPSLALVSFVAVCLIRLAKQYKIGATILGLLIIGSLFFITATRAYQWSSVPLLTWANVQAHPFSARANYEVGVWYYDAYLSAKEEGKRKEYAEYAQKYFRISSECDEKGTSGLVGLLWLESKSDAGIVGVSSDYKELIKRIASQSIGEAKGGQLISWFQCYMRGECSVELGLMRNILSAIIESQRASERVKGRLAHLFGLAMLNQKNTDSVIYIKQAISFEPTEGQYWVALIHALIENGKYAEANLVYEQFSMIHKGAFTAVQMKLKPYRELLNR